MRLGVDGPGQVEVATGLPFFDHMLSQLGRHGGFDLELKAAGDLAVDAHHTVEDVGIVLGEALHEALGDKAGVRRFASIAVPLDEALIEVALDLSGRPFLVYEVDPGAGGEAYPLGDPPFDPQLAEEFWRAFCTSAAITLHIRMRSGRNTHHILEACFKAVARALRDAVRVEGGGCRRPRVSLGEDGRVGPFIAVVDYGIGNLRSAEKGSLPGGCRCPPGHQLRPTSPRPTASCCPGSAILAAAARLFRSAGSGGRPSTRPRRGRPFLGICVGMQLLYEGSEESPGVPGLRCFEGTVALLPDGVRRPQMQWNLLDVRAGSRLLKGFEQDAWVYFVHSYAAPVGPRNRGDL